MTCYGIDRFRLSPKASPVPSVNQPKIVNATRVFHELSR